MVAAACSLLGVAGAPVLGVCLGCQILEIAWAQLHGFPSASSEEFGSGVPHVKKLESPHCGVASITIFGQHANAKVRHSYAAPVCHDADGFCCGNFENPQCFAFRHIKTPRSAFWSQWHPEQCGREHMELILDSLCTLSRDAI